MRDGGIPRCYSDQEMLTPMSISGWLDALTATMHGHDVTLDDSFEEAPHA